LWEADGASQLVSYPNGEGDFNWISEDQNGNIYTAIQSITLPGQTYWGFIYDSASSGTYIGHYGTISQLVLPGGVTINYTYNLGNDVTCYPVATWGTTWQGQTTPMLNERDVNDNNGDIYHWHYTIFGPDTGGIDVAQNPNGNHTTYQYRSHGSSFCLGISSVQIPNLWCFTRWFWSSQAASVYK